MSTSESAANPTASSIKPAKGKLGVMVPGMGAVATTLIAGVEAVRRGMALPIGSTTQMGTIRLGKRTDGRSPLIKDFVPLADLNDIVFTGWDIFGGNLYDAARTASVLDRDQIEQMKPYLQSIEPMPAAFDQHYVKRLTGKKIKSAKNKCDLATQIRNDIAEFKTKTDRQVMLW
ncbi:MAG: inositol-3-phosphate synthase, partial [Acidobacteriaceae bacterium]|nr:inositol-3-phosphate synthase [Acidobacteriaceae bacterium]